MRVMPTTHVTVTMNDIMKEIERHNESRRTLTSNGKVDEMPQKPKEHTTHHSSPHTAAAVTGDGKRTRPCRRGPPSMRFPLFIYIVSEVETDA